MESASALYRPQSIINPLLILPIINSYLISQNNMQDSWLITSHILCTLCCIQQKLTDRNHPSNKQIKNIFRFFVKQNNQSVGYNLNLIERMYTTNK